MEVRANNSVLTASNNALLMEYIWSSRCSPPAIASNSPPHSSHTIHLLSYTHLLTHTPPPCYLPDLMNSTHRDQLGNYPENH
jgi:hypothetical protein